MKFVKFFVTALLTVLMVYALSRPWGPAPAMGAFLSPYTGFWQNWEKKYTASDEFVIASDSLREEVVVRFDDTGVPHIFAQNDYDLYFAQGYVTAKDRLWQMDLQTRAASGRLSEVLGSGTLKIDEQSRQLGMNFGAEANFEIAMSDPRSREALLGYAAGINAYINNLKPKDYPVEFKLLGYHPTIWKPIYTMYMMEQMTLNLAGRSNDINMTNVLAEYGKDIVADLFPDYPKFEESPIIPIGTPWNFDKVPTPIATPILEQSDTSAAVFNGNIAPLMEGTPKIEGLGSNNWAISAEKSNTGYPILANDPHLELTLPSIWYQVQLHSPNMNVCGVSLPGVPSVIIGFNQNIAWGVTNVDADVYDLYKIKFKDSTMAEYWHDNQWKHTQIREERIQIKGEVDPKILKITYTHHGPVFSKTDADNNTNFYASKWIGREPGNSFLTFYGLNIAKNFEEYREALRNYVGPAQNFIFADNAKDIAITVNGKFPLKYKNQGKFVLDGTNPTDDWQGWIPFEQNPFVKNPERGFVSSANQSSTDPSYPYYLNWSFAPSERGVRINERLAKMTNANADSLRHLQNDNFSVMARSILPFMLDILRDNPGTSTYNAGFKILSDWDMVNSPESIAATIFETWMQVLLKAIWKDEFSSKSLELAMPSRDRTFFMLINEPDAKWFDNVTTPQVETMPQIVLSSFSATLDTLIARHGNISPAWQWSDIKEAEIRHLSSQIKPFNAPKLKTGGGASIVNAITKTHGPSWRMVVELGAEPKAFGIYPGGQSGNPGSPYYLNMLDKWEKGELNELVFLKDKEDSNVRLTSKMIFKKN